MVISSKGILNPISFHYNKRYAIYKPPFLIMSFVKKFKTLIDKGSSYWHDLYIFSFIKTPDKCWASFTEILFRKGIPYFQ